MKAQSAPCEISCFARFYEPARQSAYAVSLGSFIGLLSNGKKER
jgi:hypothetical protein